MVDPPRRGATRLDWTTTEAGPPQGAGAIARPLDALTPGVPGRAGRWLVGATEAARGARDRLAVLAAREGETGAGFHLAPVCLGLGILIYFAAPREPVFLAVAASALAVIAAAIVMRRHGAMFHLFVAVALVLSGMTAAQWRTISAGGPAIKGFANGGLSGLVISRDLNSQGKPRYLIRPTRLEGLEGGALPRLVRLSAASRHSVLAPGETIAGAARLQSLSGPAYPGGYDFGFFGWYEGFGATGYFVGPPKRAERTEKPQGIVESAQIWLNRARLAIASRIRAGLPDESGDIAIALMIGDRTGIDGSTQESLRKSGLAHILAISGLHMALVTLAVVAALRFLLSLSPRLALRHPIRKWAAGAGFAAATAYLFLSGASVATQRAYVMIAVMLLATLVDRRAITLRNLALAALAILLATPEALLGPGFQMSFAAAGALVASYSAATRWRHERVARREAVAAGQGVFARIVGHVGGLAFTSLVAGLATGIFAAWHFHRIAPLGLLANLTAMPIVSFAVMPLALVATLLMPYGLEQIALVPLGHAVNAVVAISDWVNGFPVPSVTGARPAFMLGLGATGLTMLICLNTRLRLLGLAPLAAMGLYFAAPVAPDIAIAQDGRTIAMRNAEGLLAPLYPRRNRFVTDIWVRAWSHDIRGDASGMTGECGKDYCAATSPGGVKVAVVYAPKRIQEACDSADILLAPRLKWINCKARKPALILKRADFEAGGAHVIRFVQRKKHPGAQAGSDPPDFVVQSAIASLQRPWNRARMTPVPDGDQALQ